MAPSDASLLEAVGSGQRPKPKNEHIRVYLRMRPFNKSESEKDSQDQRTKMHQKWVITD